MNKDTEILTKRFLVEIDEKNNHCSHNLYISRADYESLPIPMKAFDWSDEKMENLALKIGEEISQYRFDLGLSQSCIDEDYENALFIEMEMCAIDMGMKYYEDDK